MSFVKVAHSLPQRWKKCASFKTFNVSNDPDLDLDVELSEPLVPSIIQVYSYLCLHIEVKAQVLWTSDQG